MLQVARHLRVGQREDAVEKPRRRDLEVVIDAPRRIFGLVFVDLPLRVAGGDGVHELGNEAIGRTAIRSGVGIRLFGFVGLALFGLVFGFADRLRVAVVGALLRVGGDAEGDARAVDVALGPKGKRLVVRRHRHVVGAGRIAGAERGIVLLGDSRRRAFESLRGGGGVAGHERGGTGVEVVEDERLRSALFGRFNVGEFLPGAFGGGFVFAGVVMRLGVFEMGRRSASGGERREGGERDKALALGRHVHRWGGVRFGIPAKGPLLHVSPEALEKPDREARRKGVRSARTLPTCRLDQ